MAEPEVAYVPVHTFHAVEKPPEDFNLLADVGGTVDHINLAKLLTYLETRYGLTVRTNDGSVATASSRASGRSAL